jgi:hypothetical protein
MTSIHIYHEDASDGDMEQRGNVTPSHTIVLTQGTSTEAFVRTTDGALRSSTVHGP